MEKITENAVRRAIDTMRENLAEELTVADMARAARFSKFHFTRIFQRVTGITPGRFLSALRLQRAKHLLLSTSWSVTDISHRVGYTSVGTFSTRFSSSVGVSPSTYRRLRGFATHLETAGRGNEITGPVTTLHGTAVMPGISPAGLIVIGLFRDRIPQGRPVRCTVLPQPGPYRLENVPRGAWHVIAYSAGAATAVATEPHTLHVAAHGPVKVRADTATRRVDLRLRPMDAFDPPVLLPLPAQAAACTVIGSPPRTRRESIGSGTTW